MLQFLERLTGVTETNITAWRRQTFGDLTSALGFSNGKATTFPRTLPNTIGEFWEAEKEVATLPAADRPGRQPDAAGPGEAPAAAAVDAAAATAASSRRRKALPATSQPARGEPDHPRRRLRAEPATRCTWRGSRRSRTSPR